MGQYWDVFDIDGELTVAELTKLGEGLWSSYAHALVAFLARPIPSKEPAVKTLVRPYQCSSSGLFRLPLELIGIILAELAISSRSDLLSLTMANRTLYTIGFKHFQNALCQYEVPSAGHRLICLGGGSQNDDLPASILPEELEKASEAWELDRKDKIQRGEEDDFHFYTHARNKYPKPMIFGSREWKKQWEERSGSLRPRWSSPTYQYEQEVLRDLLRRRYPPDLKWILCNLTKRVYFTADAVSEFSGESPNGPFFYDMIGMGEVLLCQICWSTDSGTNMPYDGPLHRGKWAADRFEITTTDRLSDLEPITGGEQGEWKDVSDVVIGDMAAIYRAEFGDEEENGEEENDENDRNDKEENKSSDEEEEEE